MCSGSEAGSYLRLRDSCITQLKAQGPSRTCNESRGERKASCHARVFEGVAKSHFILKAAVFKSQSVPWYISH